MYRRLVARSTILISHLPLSSSRPPCDELEVAVPRNADGAFAAAVNALQVAALDVVVERPAMDLEPLQHVLVADDVRRPRRQNPVRRVRGEVRRARKEVVFDAKTEAVREWGKLASHPNRRTALTPASQSSSRRWGRVGELLQGEAGGVGFYIAFAAGSFGVWENASEFQDLQYSKTPSSESNGLEL